MVAFDCYLLLLNVHAPKLSTFQIKQNTMRHGAGPRRGVTNYEKLHILYFVRSCMIYLCDLRENEKGSALAETESMEAAQVPAA